MKIKAEVKKDCFAFCEVQKEEGGITWTENKCDCLNKLQCSRGPCKFYKPANTLIRYEYKIEHIPGVGYMER